MNNEICPANDRHMTSIFEKYLTVWVGLCIVAGIFLGKIAPELAKTLDVHSDSHLPVLHDVPNHGQDRFRYRGQGRKKRKARLSDPVHQLVRQTIHHVCHRHVFFRIPA